MSDVLDMASGVDKAMTSVGQAQPRVPRPRYRLVRPVDPAGRPEPTLDPAQRAVVAHRTGPLVVVGGPGTGKTTVLVEAVAARVAEGVDPAHILVLTVGRRGARMLRERIEARIAAGAGATMSEPVVRTVPGYAFGLLRLAAADRGEPAPRLLTGPEQDAVIRDLLAAPGAARRWPAALRPAVPTRAFAGQLRELLLRVEERGLSAGELAALGRQDDRPDWVAAAGLLDEYRGVLARRAPGAATTRGGVAFDPAGLVRAAGELLADTPALLAAERARRRYVYVDELAEADPAQLDLLGLVAGAGAALVGLVDPDATEVPELAARFRTASGEPAPQLVLARRYRGVPGRSTAVRTLRSVTSESVYVAHQLREAHLYGEVPWSRMAVVVRSLRHQHAALRRALTQCGIPVATAAEDTALATAPAVAAFLLLVRCAVDESALVEETAVSLLHSAFGGADPLAERRLRQGLRDRAARGGDHRASGDLLVEALRDPAYLDLDGVTEPWARPAQALAGLVAIARELAARPTATAEEVLWGVWRRSGLAQRWGELSAAGGRRGATADRDLDTVVVLFDAAARFTDRLPGAGVEAFLDHLIDEPLPADTVAATADRGEVVRILTPRTAQGQEWDVVAVVGVQEGVWPDLRLRDGVLGSQLLVDVVEGRAGARLAALMDAERHLFSVAVSRARSALLVTAVDPSGTGSGGEEQPSRFLAELLTDPAEQEGGSPAVPPRPLTLPALVAELRTVVVDPAQPDPVRRAAAAALARLAAEGVAGADPDEWWGLRELSDDRPLAGPGQTVKVSPSTVESVLQCGLRWLLERHGGGDPPTAKQSVGNLVHAAAELVGDPASGSVGDDEVAAAIRAYVAGRFSRIELPARWLGQREQERTAAMVDKLIDWLRANPRQQLAIERAFDRWLRPGPDPAGARVLLRGRVDRLERDDQGRLVVVDLKTGAHAPGAEDILRHPQLAAYQVAVEAGAFPEGSVSGGAEIVAVGTKGARAAVRVQPPLVEYDDPGWAEGLVRQAATAMAAATFRAVVNDACPYCAVRTLCPLTGQGRQVTQG